MATKLDQARQDVVCEALEKGMTLKLAAMYAKIRPNTLFDWRARGEEEEEGVYRDFLIATDAAQAQLADDCLAIIHKAASNGKWQAGAWLMERRFGFVAKQEIKQEISGPDGGAVQINVKFDKLDAEQLRVLMAGDVEEDPEDGTPDP